MLFDNHMHTRFSGDSEADPYDMIEAAKEKGLSGITFTDHLDWDFYRQPGYFDLDVPLYLKTMRRIAEEESTESFTIKVGIELGMQEHLTDRHKKLLSDYSFDLVIGSIHQVDKKDPYYDDFWEGRDYDSAYARYFELTLSNLKAFPYIDVLGHLDYISRYGMRVAKSRGGDGVLHYENHSAIIDEILKFIIANDIALEINTAPYRHGFDTTNPSLEIIDRYIQLGGSSFSLGADAHKPADVAIGFDKLPQEILKLF